MKYSEHARPSWIFKGNGFDKGYCRPNHPIIVPATGYKGHSGNGVYILHYRRIHNKIIRNRNYQLHFALASMQQGINKTPCKWTWDLILCRFTSSSFTVQPANISETQVLLEQFARYRLHCGRSEIQKISWWGAWNQNEESSEKWSKKQ